MKIAIPDMLSNSFFPLLAAAELGLFAREGLDVEVELLSPSNKAYGALREGKVDLVGSEAHSALAVYPEWRGVKLLCAQSQGMHWFLVMRADLGIARNDLAALRGRSIGAAPLVDLGLRRLLVAGGIDPERDRVRIAPIPGSLALKVNTGLMAADALERGIIDGFWANGMGAELAVTRGVGTVVLDVRRGDGPEGAFDYTFPALAATDGLIAQAPERAAAAVRAVVAAQRELKRDSALATFVGRKRFPPHEAELIGAIVARDLPFYDATLSEHTVARLNQFARDVGLLTGHPAYADVVAEQFRDLWRA